MKKVEIVEVGLRDGLQNEKEFVPMPLRVQMAEKLAEAGVKRLEVGAFVRPEKIPQMAGSKEIVLSLLRKQQQGKFPSATSITALVPNDVGMQEALSTGLKEIAIFASSTEAFSKANINCTIEESFERFIPVMEMAKKNKIKVRGYLSVCFGCPYEGAVDPKKVVQLAKKLIQIGCYEVSIGDTIGVADPVQVKSLFTALKRAIPVKKLAGHFHDTRGTALANILTAYQLGVKVFDTSLGGLGGCPYAPGSAGNVATEDVVYMFHGMGVQTGLDLSKYIEINHWFSQDRQKTLLSKVAKAGLPKNYKK